MHSYINQHSFCWYIKFVIDPERPTRKHTMIRQDIINFGGKIEVSSNRKQYLIFQQTHFTFMSNMKTLFKHKSIQHYRQMSHWVHLKNDEKHINILISKLENFNIHILSIEKNFDQTITLNFSETKNSIDKYNNVKNLMNHRNVLDYGPIKFENQPIIALPGSEEYYDT